MGHSGTDLIQNSTQWAYGPQWAYAGTGHGSTVLETQPSQAGPGYAGAGGTTLPDQHEVPMVLGGALGHPDTAEYCVVCEMWLNGESQLMDHRVGRKHRRNLRNPRPLRLG